MITLDGAEKLGAKILVAGGGRCNVTHHVVDADQYAGSSRNAIRKVLLRFDVPRTVEFFAGLSVELKQEDTGKLFPVTDAARTVLDALLRAASGAGVALHHPARVTDVRRAEDGGFVVVTERGELRAERVVLATGGRSLPKTGSDGLGHELARRLGHSITPRVFPALVPLTLAEGCFVRTLSGITVPATIELRSGTGKRLKQFTNSTLCAHFGLSGPGVLDMSRYYTAQRAEDPGASLVMNWLPGETLEGVDSALLGLGKASVGRWLKERLPERLAEAICREAGVEPGAPASVLTREARRRLAGLLVETRLPVTGDRGYNFAEVTAGGVPLSELHLETMESRVCPGLYICGELCDVDGRIGGFNFQWAWASGFVAGCGAAAACG